MPANNGTSVDQSKNSKARRERYKDLIFSPLALPSPPAVDTKRLIRWMKWAEKESFKRGYTDRREKFEKTHGRPYPWVVAHVTHWEYGNVEASFERNFPEILDYCRRFPIDGLGQLVLIAQQSGLDIHLHSDMDGFDGFRFYLANKRAEGLHFHMAWDRQTEFPRTPPDWSPFVDLSRKHYANFPEKNLPFRVNSRRAAHAVDPNTCKLGDRIGCLLFPWHSLLEDKLIALLDRSSQRFADHQLWYRKPRRPQEPVGHSPLLDQVGTS